MHNHHKIQDTVARALASATKALQRVRSPHEKAAARATATRDAAKSEHESAQAAVSSGVKALAAAKGTAKSAKRMGDEHEKRAADTLVSGAEKRLSQSREKAARTELALRRSERALRAARAPFSEAEEIVKLVSALQRLIESAQEADEQTERDRPTRAQIIDDYRRESDPLGWDRDHDMTR